jgi:hypothetical protein
VVGGGVGAGVPRSQHHRQRLSRAVRSVVDERAQRAKPKPLCRWRQAISFSECAVTKVATMSMISGRPASISRSGTWSPAAIRWAVERAESIAADAFGATAANASISRETVGSDATRPKIAGSARSSAISAGQSPPGRVPSQIGDDLARIVGGHWFSPGCKRTRGRSGQTNTQPRRNRRESPRSGQATARTIHLGRDRQPLAKVAAVPGP